MRKNPFLHAGEEYNGEFQPLRRMKCHKRHAVIHHICVVDIRDQRNLPQKILKRRLFLTLHEILCHTDKFLQIF